MKLGIDASNILTGGGVTHLKKILEHADLSKYGIQQVVVWGGANTLEELPQRSGSGLHYLEVLNNSFSRRLLWQQMKLSKLAKNSCDILFVPGGLYLGGFRPYVAMFQNMQVFDTKE